MSSQSPSPAPRFPLTTYTGLPVTPRPPTPPHPPSREEPRLPVAGRITDAIHAIDVMLLTTMADVVA